jgi:hypothetical protein
MAKTSLALLTTVALGLAATAHADLTWDWSYTGTSGPAESPLVSGSGTLTTGPLSAGAYPITGFFGTFAGSPITGLDASIDYNGFPDQTLYTPVPSLSSAGIGFDIPGDVVNIFEFPIGGGYTFIATDYLAAGNFYNVGSFTATLVPAPEPSQVVSMLSLAGMGGAGLLLKLRRRK